MEKFKNASKITIDAPCGLDAEFSGISSIKEQNGEPIEMPECSKELNLILSTSSYTLGELLEERRNQVKELEKLLSILEQDLNKKHKSGEEFVIFFQID